MSDTFAEYATSTAFNLSLSKQMIECLLSADCNGTGKITGGAHTWRALHARGLMEQVKTDRYPFTKVVEIQQISEAGKAVCVLLRLAGFDENYLASEVTEQ